MISVSVFRMDNAQRFVRLEDLDEASLRSFSSTGELRAELVPLLPSGMEWPEGSNTAEWHKEGTDWFQVRVDPPQSLLFHAWSVDGVVLETIRRMYATNRWAFFDIESGEVLVPDLHGAK